MPAVRIRTLAEMKLEIIGRVCRLSPMDTMMVYGELFHAEIKGLRISTDDEHRYYIEAKGYGKNTLPSENKNAPTQ